MNSTLDFKDPSWTKLSEGMMGFLEEVLRQAGCYFSGHQRTVFTVQLLQLQLKKQGGLGVDEHVPKEAVKSVSKFGKNMLKEVQNRNDLLLWDAYIRTLWACGKKEEASSMLETALTMFSKSADADSQAGLCALYRTLAQLTLGFAPLEIASTAQAESSKAVSGLSERKTKVLGWFSCLVDKAKFKAGKGETVSAAIILKTRKRFNNLLTDLFASASLTSSETKTHAPLLVSCFALFELCASGMAESLQVYDRAFDMCDAAAREATSAFAKETVTAMQSRAAVDSVILLRNCMGVGLTFLGQVRSWLTASLSRFPHNPDLLRHLLNLDVQASFLTRPQRHVQSTSVFPVLLSVLAEMKRHEAFLAADDALTRGQGKHLVILIPFVLNCQVLCMELQRTYVFIGARPLACQN
jgi:hypothetical protein